MFDKLTQDPDITLILIALLPAIVLCIFIYKKDRAEKEPIRLLLLLFILGAVSCYPAAELEKIGTDILDDQFATRTYRNDAELASILKEYYVWFSFAVVALAEEGMKFLMLWFATRKNKNFNSLFDGIVYAVFVSLGFAALENVLYAVENGMEVAKTRMYTAVPAHMFFGVLMGFFYSEWNIRRKARMLEEGIVRQGIVQKPAKMISGTSQMVLTLFMPILAHGAYDYFAFTSGLEENGETIFYVFLAILYVYCFRKVIKVSKKDTRDIYLADAMILKKYPNLESSFSKNE